MIVSIAGLNVHGANATEIRCRAYQGKSDGSSAEQKALEAFYKGAGLEVMIGDQPALKDADMCTQWLGTEQWIFQAFHNNRLVGLIDIRKEEAERRYSRIKHLITSHDAPLAIAAALVRCAALYLYAENFAVGLRST